MKYLLSAFLLMLSIAPVTAQERILSYDSEVEIRADGSLDVTEHILVRAEGNDIRRGIYRDFPTRYPDRQGNRVVVGFEMIDVRRDDKPEPWFIENRANGVRINTGDDEYLPTPAEFTYTLRYRTTRQLGFFPTHDELYWNAIGTGWDFPIERGSVRVRLPQPVPVSQMQLEAYTGRQGQQGRTYQAEATAPGAAQWSLTRPLAPGEGLTVVLGFPKGIVTVPTRMQRWMWLLKDNRGVLIALAGLFALLGFCTVRWRQVGRDPAAGVIIIRYEPPAGYSPAGLRFIRKMGYDTRCFSADILALAVAGELRILRDKKTFSEEWRLERTETIGKAMPAEQQALLFRLFLGGRRVLELKSINADTVSGAQSGHARALGTRFKPAMFNKNGGSVGLAVLILLATAVLAFLLSGGGGLPIIILLVLSMLVITFVFARLVRAPTPAGRKLLDEIEGFRRYLSVAEHDELKQLSGPDAPPVLNGKRYESLLPYAVALEVEDAWTEKFTAAAGVAVAAETIAGIAWYRGGHIGNLGSFSSALSRSLTSQIASASSPPGSSSGGGGGGFSGGGGGGGGGGGR